MSIERSGTPGKYPLGTKVVIKGNIAGIVLSSYNMYSEGHAAVFIYRVLVDAFELCHRCRYNHTDQRGDKSLIAEDMHQLITDTNQVAVIECSEEELQDLETFLTN